ncbi:transcription factor atoh8 isoform X2 [Labrus mixtus]|uniref:transcription factor atoh8 isoform X2 n=1 Tax=Labrus mixtus TaxID=508554 RepID=UPI0029BFBB7C|nr:transcription factor atoh8 isoform X2 [Labrus mixtus]
MKNLDQLSQTWNRSISKDPVLVSNKKFKRKSREPKRLCSDPEPDRARSFPADGSDVDSADEAAPLRRQLMQAESRSAGILSGLTEGGDTRAHSGALDMRIGINVPSITPKLTQVPSPSLSEISHWSPTISQPLTHRLRPGHRSTFSLSASTSSSLSLEPALTGLPMPRTPQSSQSQEHLEPQAQSPRDSPRKRAGLNEDGPGPGHEHEHEHGLGHGLGLGLGLGLGHGPAHAHAHGHGHGHGRIPEVKAVQQTRRLLANARERTRVHTISAAFEALRKQE